MGGSITNLCPSQHHHSHRTALLTATPLNFWSLLRKNDRDYDAQNFRIFISPHYLPPHLKRKKSMTCCGAHPRCWHGIALYKLIISSIFYFSKSTSINTQYNTLWDTLKMMLFTKYLIKWTCIGRVSLTGGNWQKWKRVFLTCPCHEIYRDEAAGLKSCKNTWKITIFVKMWNLGQNRENLIFCQ